MEKIKNLLDKLKNKKIIGLLLSIVVILLILTNSTYSLLVKTDQTAQQSYSTGVLTITSNATNNSVKLTNALPMTDTAGASSTAYTFQIKNTGTVKFQYNVKLLSTTTSNQIAAQYVKIKVNSNSVTTLSALTDGIILSNQTLAAGATANVTLRVWLASNTPNSQIGKVLNAQLVTEGQAVY